MSKIFKLEEFGYEVVIGKYANQADGAAWFQQGGTIILSTAVSSPAKEFPGFLPLTVDYREMFAAAGKIPGGYFKREGKFSDKEVLTARLIDRAIRPLFPESYFDQLQVINTVYSFDGEHMPAALSLVAASIALTISKIPFMGPVGAIEVARVEGEWIYGPTYEQSKGADAQFIIAGNKDGICMLEGSANEISEEDFLDIMFKAHEKIKKQVAWQEEIRAAVGVEKENAVDSFDWNAWIKRATDYLTMEVLRGVFVSDKNTQKDYLKQLKKDFLELYKPNVEVKELTQTELEYIYGYVLQKRLTQAIFEFGKRIDGRDFFTVRPISNDVGVLPYAHGSDVFKRGQTQALVSVTLGGGQAAQRVEELMAGDVSKNFMLHYNFLPFSSGETRPNRGPGRREVGHGYLAKSALEPVLPDHEKFPYTIRVVADILESDGSTSQATVCGGTMALMNAGVPIRKMVSGIAMGLLQSSKGEFQTITDIAGIEDAFGLMDFKVAGTDDGITAIQMDIKHKGGLVRSIFEAALKQAKEGRAHILSEMRKVLSAPNPKLSDLVPQFVSVRVPTDKIGAIIGSGGKVIREMTEKTGTTIDIEDTGVVKIFGQPGPKMDQAVSWVKILGGLIEQGAVYPGTVKRYADFGIFVEIAPGQDGLVHVSTIPKERQGTIMKELPVGSEVQVKVLDYDPVAGRIRLSFI
jgi:polyribonucleotide nucleotidyltransferase